MRCLEIDIIEWQTSSDEAEVSKNVHHLLLLKTEHLVAHAHFSECPRPFDHHTHLRVAQGLDGSCLGCVGLLRILKVIHSQRVSSTTP